MLPKTGLAGILFVAIALQSAVAAMPVGAQMAAVPSTCLAGPPVLQLANPNPGDVLSQGDYLVSGIAFDPNATGVSGIDRVDVFLGERDAGGLFLGSAAPGQNTTANGRDFEVKASIPSTANGGRDFVAYAYSAMGQQTSVVVPVFVGAAPTPTPSSSSSVTPVALSDTVRSSCRATSATTAPPAVSAARPAGPVLQLGNPSAGDLLLTGDVFVDGVAYDPTATTGDGVDRVELFLDSRDSGGTALGSGVPGENAAAASRTFHIKANVPNTANGGHTLFAYAHSSITGQETVVSVPVFIGAPPTPTPRPTTNGG